MVSRLFVILSVAVLFFGVFPAVSAFFYRRRLERRIGFLRGAGLSAGVYARVSGFSAGKILLESAATGSLISVVPLETVFFLCDGGIPKKVPWRFFLSLPRGLKAFYIPPAGFSSPVKTRQPEDRRTAFAVPRLLRRRGMCVFFEPENETASPAASSLAEGESSAQEPQKLQEPKELQEFALPEFSLPQKTESPLKPFFVAAGAFLEFVFFLALLREGGASTATVTALAAIFGRAAPYCPPGLFFLLWASALAARNPARKLPAFALRTAGVAVNVAVFLLIVGSFAG